MNGLLGPSGVYEMTKVGPELRLVAALTSTDPGRKIEVSIDDGITYFEPDMDVREHNVIGVSIRAAVTNIRWTGAQGDKWGALF